MATKRYDELCNLADVKGLRLELFADHGRLAELRLTEGKRGEFSTVASTQITVKNVKPRHVEDAASRLLNRVSR
jgi:hypothetical protein